MTVPTAPSLPGAGLAVDAMPSEDIGQDNVRLRFPSAISDWAPAPFTVPERMMLQLINHVTDKSKVFNHKILDAWKEQVSALEGFTGATFDFVRVGCGGEVHDEATRAADKVLLSALRSFKTRPRQQLMTAS